MKIICKLGLVLAGFALCQTAQAQTGNEEELRATVKALQSDVNELKRNQEQIAGELKELKKLLEANFDAPPPPVHPPPTMSVAGESFRGDKTARAVLIEYGDFECPFCELFTRETFPHILSDYVGTSQLRFIYRDLTNHPRALPAARAAHCAGDQAKFWEMHEELLANQTALTDKDILARASALGLDSNEFGKCFSSEKYADQILKSTADARAMGIGGTPTFLVGVLAEGGNTVKIEKTIIGAQPYETFKSAIDSVLSSLEKKTTAKVH